jgi:hypothetical protein
VALCRLGLLSHTDYGTTSTEKKVIAGIDPKSGSVAEHDARPYAVLAVPSHPYRGPALFDRPLRVMCVATHRPWSASIRIEADALLAAASGRLPNAVEHSDHCQTLQNFICNIIIRGDIATQNATARVFLRPCGIKKEGPEPTRPGRRKESVDRRAGGGSAVQRTPPAPHECPEGRTPSVRSEMVALPPTMLST